MKQSVFKDYNAWLKDHRQAALIAGPLIVLIVGLIMYLLSGRYVSTDDAYILSARTQITSNVSGQVVKVHVHDNQEVKAGDILFELDQRPFKFKVDEAKANLASKRLSIEGIKTTYKRALAELQGAKNTLTYQQKEFNRQKKLLSDEFSSKAQFDQTKRDLDNAQQQVEAYEQQRANALVSLNGDPDIKLEQHPSVQEAQAALDQAQLNLSYAAIQAPADGIVTKVEQLQVGDYVNASTPVFFLVSTEAVWVEANYKETELTNMKAGQKATFTIDTYPGKKFKGRVESICPGTGSSFSLLPPENATGNWVKVVQRLPVRIAIDDKHSTPLRAGSSVIVDVDTKSRQKKR
jgi:membrane fusion protein, multidrug efflux system